MSAEIRNRKSFLLIPLTLLFTCCFLFSCNSKEDKETGSYSDKVSIVEAKKGKYVEELNSFGSITYNTKNDVTSLEPGQLYYFPFKEGDSVSKGQVIARLKNVQLEFQKEQYENALTTANASLAIQKNNLRESRLGVESKMLSLEGDLLNIQQKELELKQFQEQLKNKTELYEIGGVTDSQLKQLQLQEKSMITDIEILKKQHEISSLGMRDQDLIEAGYKVPSNPEEKKKLLIELNTKTVVTQIEAAEAEVRNARTSLNSINKLLDELTIKAPISGIIGVKKFETGEYVESNAVIATIIETSSVYALIYLQEKDVVNYAIGTQLKIEIPSLDKSYTSQINEISPIADTQSGNFAVKAAIKNNNDLIKPGMFVKCSIINNVQDEYIKLPESVLLFKNENSGTVFCVKNKLAVQKKIEIRAARDGFIWVTSGISENEIVINNPSPFLKEGQSVSW